MPVMLSISMYVLTINSLAVFLSYYLRESGISRMLLILACYLVSRHLLYLHVRYLVHPIGCFRANPCGIFH